METQLYSTRPNFIRRLHEARGAGAGLSLNYKRYAKEVARGLHDKGGKGKRAQTAKWRAPELFDEEEVLNVLLQHQKVWLKAYQIANKVALQLERDDVSPHSVETIISTMRARGIPIHNKYGRGYRLMLAKEVPQHATPEYPADLGTGSPPGTGAG